MFRDWTKNVKSSYPDLEITIVDESVLVDDLVETIKSAKHALQSEEEDENRKIPGFDTGFIWGFINGNLHQQWDFDYIVKQSDAYKEFIAFKAVKLFLEFDKLTAIRIEAIYKHLMAEDINIDNPDIKISKKVFDELSYVETETSSNTMIGQALENKIAEYIRTLYNRRETNFLNPTELYFSEEEIQAIISNDLNL